MLLLVSRRRGRLPRVWDVDDEDAVAASGDDELDGLGVAQVLLDVDFVRGDVEEVAGLHVLVVLELVAPVEADAAFEHVDRRLAVAVVVAPLVCSETPASRVMPVVWAVLQSRSVGRITLIPAMADLSRSRRSGPAYRRPEARTRTVRGR